MATIATTAVSTQRKPELVGQTVVVIGGSSCMGLETAWRVRCRGRPPHHPHRRDEERLKQAALELDAHLVPKEWADPIISVIAGPNTANTADNVLLVGQFTTANPPTPFTGCTVTQGGWHANPHGNNPGALLAKDFPTVYPSGVTIGGNFTLTFDSAAAVRAFLPAGGTPGVLTSSATDPTASAAGVFAGQVLALQLNVDLEHYGTVVISGTGTTLDGKTVADVLAAANIALGGGPLPAGFTISTLNDFVDSLNQKFDNCN